MRRVIIMRDVCAEIATLGSVRTLKATHPLDARTSSLIAASHCLLEAPAHPVSAVSENVSVSMSSDPASYTFLPRASSAHWASVSEGAITTGIPINLRGLRHSSLCSRVTLTVRREKRSTSSAVPVSLALLPLPLPLRAFQTV